eukprot:gene8126-11004_t
MVNISSIAIFILATTKQNSIHEQDFRSYFESRILPISNTWGLLFPHLYFVLGTNKFDMDFVDKRCSVQKLESRRSRILIPRAIQTPIKNQIEEYCCYRESQYEGFSKLSYRSNNKNSSNDESKTCFGSNTSSASSLSKHNNNYHNHHYNECIKVLRVGNCTGEYFGSGPTCRCQESMRYFLAQIKPESFQWFLFLDDDVYIRPYSLLSFLENIYYYNDSSNVNTINNNLPIAFVSTSTNRGFSFSKKPLEFNVDCSVGNVHEFSLAQPALLNKCAMEMMKNAIIKNGLTSLQSTWGGSHDSTLGMLLWMYSIPTYSFEK